MPPIIGLRPFFWAAAYVLVTTFSLSPMLSFRGRPDETGSVARRDVVAPRDLIVPDPVATERRKSEAVADVLPVYDWDVGAGARVEKKLRDSFQIAREAWAVTRRRPGSGPVPQSVRDAFELPIRDEALAALTRLSLPRDVEDRLAAASVELYRAGVVDNRDLMMENGARGLQLRDSASGREVRRKELAEVVEYGSQAKSVLTTRLSGGPLSGRELTEVAGFLAAALRPNLVFNGAETARRREQAARSVETVLTKIPRGKVIVRKGDEISRRPKMGRRAASVGPASWSRARGPDPPILAATVFWVDARRLRRRRRSKTRGRLPRFLTGMFSL
jgi:membrane-associated HD superfamily phosphohydrolase